MPIPQRDASINAAPPAGRLPRSIIALLVALVASLLPLWFSYAVWTWKDGHYQYFPLLIAAAVWLYTQRWPEAVARASPPRVWLVATGMVLVTLLILAGHVLGSGWVGIVATIAAAVTLTYAAVGCGSKPPSWPCCCWPCRCRWGWTVN